jgi:hypothetical protein
MSKLMMFDFSCDEGHQFEELVQPKIHKLTCPTCSSDAHRLISTGNISYLKMGLDPDFPTAGDRWANMQEQRKRVEKERSL